MTEPNTGGIGASKEDVDDVAPGAKTEEKKTATVEDVEDVGDVPDPDEDDLDDLDDMLDDFSAVKIDAKKPEAAPSGPARLDAASGTEDLALSDDEFLKQLQASMAELVGELDKSPEMKAQFENMIQDLGETMSAAHASANQPGPEGSSSAKPGAASAEAAFQETIRRTLERMQASGDQATAAAAAEGSDDFIAELLKQMQSGGADGEGNEEEFSKMLLGMMEQLTNKEILYEPMKELHEKFPEWIAKNKDKVPKDDLKRYEEQYVLVKEIVAKFEEPTYSDSNTADREYIVDRMQKMQASGSPPSDLVGDMPSAQDLMNMPDESCNPQ
ncbi:hypothetical protein VTK56DRAFT_9240 [Thermocarpiscus australiensis]